MALAEWYKVRIVFTHHCTEIKEKMLNKRETSKKRVKAIAGKVIPPTLTGTNHTNKESGGGFRRKVCVYVREMIVRIYYDTG